MSENSLASVERKDQIALWQRHPNSMPLDPQVWWWRDLMKAINNIPPTHNPLAAYAACKLAGEYWERGFLPDHPVQCAKLIGFDPRTMRRHWEEIRSILETYFAEMPEARRVVIEERRAKQVSGKKGGESRRDASLQQTCSKRDARLQATSAENRRHSEAEQKREIEISTEYAATSEFANNRETKQQPPHGGPDFYGIPERVLQSLYRETGTDGDVRQAALRVLAFQMKLQAKTSPVAYLRRAILGMYKDGELVARLSDIEASLRECGAEGLDDAVNIEVSTYEHFFRRHGGPPARKCRARDDDDLIMVGDMALREL